MFPKYIVPLFDVYVLFKGPEPRSCRGIRGTIFEMTKFPILDDFLCLRAT